MGLRQYLRGLGIGIFVTALLLHFAGQTSGIMGLSDAQIKERAKQLGMIENTVLSSVADKAAVRDIDAGEGSGATGDFFDDADTPVISAGWNDSEPGGDDTLEADSRTDDTLSAGLISTVASGSYEADDPNMISIEVKYGEDSLTICHRLEEAGLIPSATDFDNRLIGLGIDNKMTVGVHKIPLGANEEEIAALLLR